jgi:hypothetical protein
MDHEGPGTSPPDSPDSGWVLLFKIALLVVVPAVLFYGIGVLMR